ncbi:Hypothetical predicted protein, partial [Paramuricea clavata]
FYLQKYVLLLLCPSCGTRKGETSGIISASNTETDSANADSSKRKRQSASTNPPSFSAYMKQKETERQSHFNPNKNKGRVGETQAKAKDEVIINVGLMEYEYGEAKIQRGKSFPVKLSRDMDYDERSWIRRNVSRWKIGETDTWQLRGIHAEKIQRRAWQEL